MDRLQKLSLMMEVAIRVLVIAFMLFMLGTVLLDVLARNTALRIRGLDELARYSLIWIVFLATAAGARYGDLIGMDALPKMFPLPVQTFLWLLRRVIFLAFLVGFAWYALGLVQLMIKTGRSSPNLHIPLWLVYAPLFVGTVLMALSTLIDAANRLATGTVNDPVEPDEGSRLWN
ncbi:TRAP transporter small permease [Roseovarius sp. ZX-A-9]|uniref:TRAP transporter small permease n=1 Tax=Roseovarius sp. ZX-A-9 TaxID=3014783 RepID=UPI00232F3464|nr:TRAP transporter small permease [Roseovarius sp. ZX-A-9]